MANKVPLKKVTNILTSVGTLNENFERIENGFDKTLSRDGSGPNQMEALIDMNQYPIINLPKAHKSGMPVTYDQLNPDAQEVVVVPVGTDDLLNGAVTAPKLTDDPAGLEAIVAKLLFTSSLAGAVSQPLSSILEYFATPMGWGAKGDGTADDTAQVNA